MGLQNGLYQSNYLGHSNGRPCVRTDSCFAHPGDGRLTVDKRAVAIGTIGWTRGVRIRR